MKFKSLTLLAITAFIGLLTRCTLANPDGFLSINCGASNNGTNGEIDWITDSLFIKYRNTSIMPPFTLINTPYQYQSMAYFTNMEANKYCYLLPVRPHIQYLVRVSFFLKGFENLRLASTFDLYIEGINWAKVKLTNSQMYRPMYYEIILAPKRDSMTLCLARNSDTQESYYVFISTIRLRPLQPAMYNTFTDFNYSALLLFYRINFGSSYEISFPDDQYDRLWEPPQVTLTSTYVISTNDSFLGSIRNQPPVSVLKTAITSLLGEDQLLVSNWHILPQGIYYFAVYLCNINKTSLSGNNTFQIFIGNVQIAEIVVPEYMYCLSPETRLELSTTDSTDIRIRSKTGSEMRPFINAAEAYQIVKITNMTHAGDVLAIRKIADTVNVPDDWTTGDPCLPAGLPLTGVMCNEEDPPRVIIVNLTNKGLTGNIPPTIANLTALKQLNNKLDGDVPPGLVKPGLNLQVLPQSKFLQDKKNKEKDKDDPNEFQKVVVEYSEEDIKAATNNYSTIIGKGGFGIVFYGQLSGNDVAVKILSTDSCQGKQEFRNEVTLLSRVHHKNLVNLLGYCRQPIVALLYEFMEYGTLTNHIHGSAKRERPLDWQTRINIALQAAEGLLYLHEGCSPPIIHRDIKCTNILLDKNMSAKITDFGLSKLLQNSRSHVTTEVKGTLGYLDPEYYGTSSLNEKSDVYSFGVVLFEIISGVPPKEGIVESAKILLSCGRIADLMDSLLGGQYSLESAWRVAEVAYNFVEPRPVNRPTMNTVVKELAEAKALVSHDGIKPTSLKVLDDVPKAR
ncbi:hypothetical protein SUGI_1428750 [Cryptomeria japonica]|uniref:Protein kinase domain-containing protein n=1 Tax=Cryptomeria japonica TaxID=3369 RepID=A0AAD3NR25_CRYJA|nr:hypothetical protein SUGI_1428750 [Cryptomeria japonica]